MADPAFLFSTLRELAKAIREHRVSPTEVVEATLARIERLNPALNAFIRVSDTALEAARAAEDSLRRGNHASLLGVPISVKDLILTRGMPTTAGSKTFGPGLKSRRDAPVIALLRRAGAIIIGKTNLHEVALGVTSVNEHFGPVRNPWAPDRVAGGSSGGSSVAVAAALGYGSIGTDTRGSIRIPAACCGVVGLKPTYGLVSVDDVIPLSPSLDHVGPITRSVEDAAVLLGALVRRRNASERYLKAVDTPSARLRVGLSEFHLRDLDGAVGKSVQEAIEELRRQGHVLSHVSMPELEGSLAASGVITGTEAVEYHDTRLKEHPEGFGPNVRSRLEKGYAWSGVDYVRAQAKRREVTAAYEGVFRSVDCLVGATLPAVAPKIVDQQVYIDGVAVNTVEAFVRFNAPQNMAGLPALSIPCGRSPAGLPIGLQLIAAAGRDDIVLAVGAEFQRETDWHHPIALRSDT